MGVLRWSLLYSSPPAFVAPHDLGTPVEVPRSTPPAPSSNPASLLLSLLFPSLLFLSLLRGLASAVAVLLAAPNLEADFRRKCCGARRGRWRASVRHLALGRGVRRRRRRFRRLCCRRSCL